MSLTCCFSKAFKIKKKKHSSIIAVYYIRNVKKCFFSSSFCISKVFVQISKNIHFSGAPDHRLVTIQKCTFQYPSFSKSTFLSDALLILYSLYWFDPFRSSESSKYWSLVFKLNSSDLKSIKIENIVEEGIYYDRIKIGIQWNKIYYNFSNLLFYKRDRYSYIENIRQKQRTRAKSKEAHGKNCFAFFSFILLLNITVFYCMQIEQKNDRRQYGILLHWINFGFDMLWSTNCMNWI